MQPPPLLLAASNLTGWVILLLGAPGLLVLVAVVVIFLVRGDRGTGDAGALYHVTGLDPTTHDPRELQLRAATLEAARGQAEASGMVVTDVVRIDARSI